VLLEGKWHEVPAFSTDTFGCNEGFEGETRKDFEEDFVWKVVRVHEGGRGTV
jgi:hypothetical protein